MSPLTQIQILPKLPAPWKQNKFEREHDAAESSIDDTISRKSIQLSKKYDDFKATSMPRKRNIIDYGQSASFMPAGYMTSRGSEDWRNKRGQGLETYY